MKSPQAAGEGGKESLWPEKLHYLGSACLVNRGLAYDNAFWQYQLAAHQEAWTDLQVDWWISIARFIAACPLLKSDNSLNVITLHIVRGVIRVEEESRKVIPEAHLRGDKGSIEGA